MKLTLFISLLFLEGLAFANLCVKSTINDRYREEAATMEQEDFASAVADYTGDREYNAWVLACNRKRDNYGNKIDKAIDPSTAHDFPENLPPKIVKGKYHFYGLHLAALTATDLKYRYRIRREQGNWIVTLPIDLHFPNRPLKNRLDISYELAYQLGIMSVNGQGNKKCDKGQETFSNKKKKKKFLIDNGFLDGTYDGLACRLPKDLVLDDGSKLLDRYFDFWRSAIEQAWNRPGFTMEVLFIDHDKISSDLKTAFKRDKTAWDIYLTLKPDQRPRYVPGFAHLKHIHTGAYGETIAHEAGHYLGLDDEYREKDKGDKNEWRNCRSEPGKDYLMCSAASVTTSGYYAAKGGINNPTAVKGIYPWIITRRYAVAKDQFCKTASDCNDDEYCAKSLVDGKRNYCEDLKSSGEKCSADKQCIAGTVCKGKPIGKCIYLSSVPLGGSCSKNAQCTTGSCNNVGVCQCKADNHCGGDEYCDKGGALGIGRNVCKKLASPTCLKGWSYQTRNPLNKDRCKRTTKQTAKLKCKLLVTDKAKNWTGPHAQRGADECRSKKGKKPKGVKCPSGFQYSVKSGEDSCTKIKSEYKTPTCPSGYKYKSVKGKDQCRRK